MSNVIKRGTSKQCWPAMLLALCMCASSTMLQAQAPAGGKRPLVEVRTEVGTLVIALHNETPVHRDNFLKLVREGAYDGLLFHRVMQGFMVQGGDPDSREPAAGAMLGTGDPGYTLPAEIVPGLVHTRGSVAAARQGDSVNPDKRSNGMQFYIVLGRTYEKEDLDRMVQRALQYGDTVVYTEANVNDYAREGGAPQLDGAYTVFGEVVDGHEVIDALAAVACNAQDRPLKDIRMFMRILE
jgi:cyclophilin family peptidyl-prolyl cis-trans isomerase